MTIDDMTVDVDPAAEMAVGSLGVSMIGGTAEVEVVEIETGGDNR
jgi:hypothetical protein